MADEEHLAPTNKGLDLQSAGAAEVVSIDRLQVDPDYQRDLRHDLVNQIGRNWDIVKAGPILVSRRDDGSEWVVDGQHRMAGAIQAGESEMFAHVVMGLTQADEAELRLARNERRSDSMAEKFKSRLTMGDPKAHAIVEVLRQQGTEINFVPSSYHGINAIATVELIYSIDNTGVWLARTIRCIREAYGEDKLNPEHLGTNMLKATCWFLAQHVDIKQVNYEEFVSRLEASGVEDIRRKAVSHKAANGGSLWINYYRALVETWNFRRIEAKKIQWKTVGSITALGSGDGKSGAGVSAEVRWKK